MSNARGLAALHIATTFLQSQVSCGSVKTRDVIKLWDQFLQVMEGVNKRKRVEEEEEAEKMASANKRRRVQGEAQKGVGGRGRGRGRGL